MSIMVDEECIKGNAVYYKIKIDEMIEKEIETYDVDEGIYKTFGEKVSESISKFSKRILGNNDEKHPEKVFEVKNFDEAMIELRDDVIEGSEKINKKASQRSYFKQYVFDKIYSIGVNIKNNQYPGDKDYDEILKKKNEELEEENAKLKDENEALKDQDNIYVSADTGEEVRKPDLVDNIFDYFFNGGKSSSSAVKKGLEKATKAKDDKSENKGKEIASEKKKIK